MCERERERDRERQRERKRGKREWEKERKTDEMPRKMEQGWAGRVRGWIHARIKVRGITH